MPLVKHSLPGPTVAFDIKHVDILGGAGNPFTPPYQFRTPTGHKTQWTRSAGAERVTSPVPSLWAEVPLSHGI